MRVLMVCNSFPRFSATFLVNKFLGLVKHGWDVHIAAQRRAADSEWDYFPTLPPRRHLQPRLHVTKDVERVVEEVQPDIVHFEFGNLAHGNSYLRTMRDFRMVVSFRGSENVFVADSSDPYRDLWDATDALHVLGAHMRDVARAAGCPEDKPVYVIPPGVDTEFFDPGDRSYEPRVGTAARPLRLLSVGRIHWKKGYEYALQAVRQLVDRGMAVEYRIVGAGSTSDADHFLECAIDDLGLRHQVTLLGPQPSMEVRAQHLWADVFVHAAVSEGFCNAVVEAQSMATPVMCTDAGGLPENVVDGQTGLVVRRRDPAALRDGLVRLAGDPRLREGLGLAGRNRAVSDLGLERQVSAFEQLYRDVADLPDRLPADAVRTLESMLRTGEQQQRRLERQLVAVRQRNSDVRMRLRVAEQHAVEQTRLDDLEGLRAQILYQEHLKKLPLIVGDCIPSGSYVLVVSRGDELFQELLPDVRVGHFPQGHDGSYLGYYFGGGDEAVHHLEALRRSGAAFLLFPSPAFWWLDHYAALRSHLDEHYALVAKDEACQLYDLRVAEQAVWPP